MSSGLDCWFLFSLFKVSFLLRYKINTDWTSKWKAFLSNFHRREKSRLFWNSWWLILTLASCFHLNNSSHIFAAFCELFHLVLLLVKKTYHCLHFFFDSFKQRSINFKSIFKCSFKELIIMKHCFIIYLDKIYEVMLHDLTFILVPPMLLGR